MYSLISSASTYGIDAFIVEIETHIEKAAPNFFMVGCPDSPKKVSKEKCIGSIKKMLKSILIIK